MSVWSAYLAGRGWSVLEVSPSFVAANCVVADTSLLAAMCLKLIYHFSLSLVLDGSPPSALLTLFGSVVLKCLSALVPYRTGPGVLPRLPETSAISSVILVNRLPHLTSPVGAYVGTYRLTVALLLG